MNPNSRERGFIFEAKGMLSEGLVHVAGPEQVRSDEMRLEGEPAGQDQRQGLGMQPTLAAGTAKFKAKSSGTEREKNWGQ